MFILLNFYRIKSFDKLEIMKSPNNTNSQLVDFQTLVRSCESELNH